MVFDSYQLIIPALFGCTTPEESFIIAVVSGVAWITLHLGVITTAQNKEGAQNAWKVGNAWII